METKVCSQCKKEKEVSEFVKDKYKKSGISSACKECRYVQNRNISIKKRSQYNRDYRKKNPTIVAKSIRESKLKNKYGINGIIYNKTEENQKGLCAICGLPEIAKTPQGKIRPLCTDHNHNTKKFRGLLCSKCNNALGLLKVDNFGILNLQMAIKYLIKND